MWRFYGFLLFLFINLRVCRGCFVSLNMTIKDVLLKGKLIIKDVLFSLSMIMLKGNIVRDSFRFYVRCFASLNMTKKVI